jgi:hypothetical protein
MEVSENSTRKFCLLLHAFVPFCLLKAGARIKERTIVWWPRSLARLRFANKDKGDFAFRTVLFTNLSWNSEMRGIAEKLYWHEFCKALIPCGQPS